MSTHRRVTNRQGEEVANREAEYAGAERPDLVHAVHPSITHRNGWRSSRMLRRLIAACVDERRTSMFDDGYVKGGGRRALLAQIADERDSFEKELEGIERPGWLLQGSVRQRLREVIWAMRSLIGGRTDGDAIADTRKSLRRTEARYEKALELPWANAATVRMLQRHLGRIAAERTELAAVQF